MEIKEIRVVNNTPIEIVLGIDENGMTTARKLYEFLELAKGQFSRWARANITENEFATENEDFWGFDINVEGNIVQDFKLTARFAKKLSMKGTGERAEQAREYFTRVEEKMKELAVDRQELSPQMQMLYGMLDQMAQTERQAKEAKQIAQKAVETTERIKEEIVSPFDNWRDDINSKVREIAIKAKMSYQQLFTEMYKELENKAGCDLSTRQRNKRERMIGNGCRKTDIDRETTKIAVIGDDKRLKQIFDDIVRRYAIKYVA